MSFFAGTIQAIRSLFVSVKRPIASWSKKPTSFMSTVSRLVNQTAISKANKIYDEVVDRSPVKTGRLRASWRMAHTKPDLSNEPQVIGWRPGTSPLPKPSRPTLTNLPLKNLIIYITNTVPYAYRFNFGHANQSPNNIVQLAVQSAR